jgi:hypothetical protein
LGIAGPLAPAPITIAPLCKLSVRLQGGPKTGRTRRQLGAHPPLPLPLPAPGEQAASWTGAENEESLGAAATSDGHRGMVLAVAWTVTPGGWVPPAGASGSGMAPNRVRLVGAEVEACPSRPPTSQDEPSRAADGGEGRSSAGSSTITTAGGPAPQRVGRWRTGWPGSRRRSNGAVSA